VVARVISAIATEGSGTKLSISPLATTCAAPSRSGSARASPTANEARGVFIWLWA
jgi:hypothetical protein